MGGMPCAHSQNRLFVPDGFFEDSGAQNCWRRNLKSAQADYPHL